MTSPSTCRNCVHWDPLFKGTSWGVKCVLDAPPAELQAIKEKLTVAINECGQLDTDKVGTIMGSRIDSYVACRASRHVPPHLPWYEWGHCVRTEFGNEDYDTIAHAIDDNECYAVLRTRHTFWCVQYKPDLISPTKEIEIIKILDAVVWAARVCILFAVGVVGIYWILK